MNELDPTFKLYLISALLARGVVPPDDENLLVAVCGHFPGILGDPETSGYTQWLAQLQLKKGEQTEKPQEESKPKTWRENLKESSKAAGAVLTGAPLRNANGTD